jgi:hypothetical protein
MIKENEMDRACNTHARNEKYKILIINLKRKKPFRRTRHRWEDNNEMTLKIKHRI